MIPRQRRIGSPTEVTRRLRQWIVHVLETSFPDAVGAGVLIERLGAPPSSVRRLLAALAVEGLAVRGPGGWRAKSPSAGSSAPRHGRPIRRAGFREAWLERRAREEAIKHG